MAADLQLTYNFERLARLDDNAPFRKWIKDTRDTWRDTLETSRDPTLFGIAQGRAQMLADIEKLMACAVLDRK